MIARLLHRLLAWLGIKPTPKPQPVPKRPLHYSIEEGPISGWAWTCLQCAGGHGSSPDLKRAREAADIHYLAWHTGSEVRS